MKQMIDKPDIKISPQFEGFEVFEVGGGVRDRFRGIDREDVDLMVVPVEIDEPVEVLSERMIRVDTESAFPVFLDDEGREVALPRTEESTGDGFSDFDVSLVSPEVPVRESVKIDLERRDLTVNAMAQNVRTGEIFDPFDGRKDLEKGRLEPVSEAFLEDPVRVLRLARFTARLDAEPSEKALKFSREVVDKLSSLPVERITKEIRKGLIQADTPSEMFRVLEEIGAFEYSYLESLKGGDFELLDKTEDPKIRMALIGIIGEAEDFIDTHKLTCEEERRVQYSKELSDKVYEIDSLSDKEIIRLVQKIIDIPGFNIYKIVNITKIRFDIDSAETIKKLDRARESIYRIDGETAMEHLGIEASDIGKKITGKDFGEHLLKLRASRL